MVKHDFCTLYRGRGTKAPATSEWFHEIKHDGYRLIVYRDGLRVRLLTRNGFDSSDRYPLVREAALRMRRTSFALDGEAVLLGVDGSPTLRVSIAASTMTKCSSMPSTC
jgi:bifunctional non-homologous end joining protein LigD